MLLFSSYNSKFDLCFLIFGVFHFSERLCANTMRFLLENTVLISRICQIKAVIKSILEVLCSKVKIEVLKICPKRHKKKTELAECDKSYVTQLLRMVRAGRTDDFYLTFTSTGANKQRCSLCFFNWASRADTVASWFLVFYFYFMPSTHTATFFAMHDVFYNTSKTYYC